MGKGIGMALLATALGLGFAGQAAANTSVEYGKGKLSFKSDDGNFAINLENQLQIRYTGVMTDQIGGVDDNSPASANGTNDTGTFGLRRMKTSLSGNAYSKEWAYKFQYAWTGATGIEDAYVGYKGFSGLEIYAGRGKIAFNLQESTSSKRQQFVDRSLANEMFNVDYGTGLWAAGSSEMSGGGINYSLGLFNGIYGGLRQADKGVGTNANDGHNYLLNGRVEYASDKNVGKGESDLRSNADREKLAFLVGLGVNYTRLNAVAIPTAAAGKGTLLNLTLDGRIHVQGFSVNAMFFHRQSSLSDAPAGLADDSVTDMGYTLQVGYNHNLDNGDQIEAAIRYSAVDLGDANKVESGKDASEIGLGVNYRLYGDHAKISMDIMQNLAETDGSNPSDEDSDITVRLQLQFLF